jgi:hypothetical protein
MTDNKGQNTQIESKSVLRRTYLLEQAIAGRGRVAGAVLAVRTPHLVDLVRHGALEARVFEAARYLLDALRYGQNKHRLKEATSKMIRDGRREITQLRTPVG